MRNLAQPQVLKSASIAALLTSLAGSPRLVLWQQRVYPIWYLEAILFLGSIVLWAFVFAWHTQYTTRAVFTLKLKFSHFLTATLAGVFAAIALHLLLDPALRLSAPEDYPATFGQWAAMTLFGLAFTELFLVFAPFAWLIRLVQNRPAATMLTVLFGAVVLMAKPHSTSTPISALLFSALFAVRIALGFLAVHFYLRGGAVLAWWWSLLVEARHLLDLRTGQ